MATQVEVPQEQVEQPNPRKFSRTVEVPGGNPQVFYGASEQEVTDKMAESIKNGTLKIRELSRKTSLETQTFTAPEGADPFEDIPEPKVRQLTPEERADIAAKMTKPETVVEAYRALYEAETGLQPTVAGKLQVQQARDAAQVKALNAARTFMEAHPEFVPCAENRDALDQFFRTRKIGPTIKNFELAFKELSANGLLTLRAEEPAIAEPATEARIEPEPEPATPAIPSALTRSRASGGGVPARKKGPTEAEKAMMTADQLKAYYQSIGQWPDSKPKVYR